MRESNGLDAKSLWLMALLGVIAIVTTTRYVERDAAPRQTLRSADQLTALQANESSSGEREDTDELVKVTNEPHRMDDQVVGLCGVLFTDLGKVIESERGPTDDELLLAIRPLSNLAKVTVGSDRKAWSSDRGEIPPSTEAAVDPSGSITRTEADVEFAEQVHPNRYCDVYVSKNMVSTLLSGEGTYTPRTIIVKAKYADQTASQVELFTIMFKRDAGYNSAHGDWEYSVVNGDATQVMTRGKLASCISCHDAYAKTDYVTRAYFGPSEE